MIDRKLVTSKILAYLNGEIILDELVDWAENSFIEGGFGPDEDIDMLTDIVSYIAGADTKGFPLTWNVIHEFLEQLGTSVKVMPV